MRPLLCASLEAATTAELCASRDGVDPAVDLIELRLDSVEDPNVGRVLKGCKRPVIVTCRPTWEGGRFNGSEEERHRILSEAIEAGADYVDAENRIIGRTLMCSDPTAALFNSNPFVHGSTMFKRSVATQLGGYDEFFRYCQDYEFWGRITKKH